MVCRFCEIVEKRIQPVIRESENTLTFLSNPCLIEGHALVIPKKHFEDIREMPKELLHEIMDEIVETKKMLLEKLEVEGCTLIQNFLPFQKENWRKVNHIHFHVIPRKNLDEFWVKVHVHFDKVFKKMSKQELEKVKEQILI
ncbi:MAG: HIT domain-containing protein [archaeon]